jgi:hypothetical protein
VTGLMDSPPHIEVAAYILGILNKEDSEAFDRHLLDCASCQDELRDMYELPDALDVIKRGMKGTVNGAAPGTVKGAGGGANGVSHAAVNGSSPSGVVKDLWSPHPRRRSPVPSHRRSAAPDPPLDERRDDLAALRGRRRRVMLLGVAAAVVIGITGAATTQVLWPRGASVPVAAGSPSGSAKADLNEGTSPDTGVSGAVGLVAKGWGTEVAFQLSGVRGPERCSLIAVSRSGDTDVVSGWRVAPGQGYGVPGHPDPLRLTGGTALAKTDIVRFEVRREDGVRLLDIPVA